MKTHWSPALFMALDASQRAGIVEDLSARAAVSPFHPGAEPLYVIASGSSAFADAVCAMSKGARVDLLPAGAGLVDALRTGAVSAGGEGHTLQGLTDAAVRAVRDATARGAMTVVVSVPGLREAEKAVAADSGAAKKFLGDPAVAGSSVRVVGMADDSTPEQLALMLTNALSSLIDAALGGTDTYRVVERRVRSWEPGMSQDDAVAAHTHYMALRGVALPVDWHRLTPRGAGETMGAAATRVSPEEAWRG